MKFGEHIDQIMRSKELEPTPTSLAIGAGRGYVGNLIARGDPPYPIALLQRLADKLGVSLAYLVDPDNSSAAAAAQDESLLRQAIATQWLALQDEDVLPRDLKISGIEFADICVRLARAMTEYARYAETSEAAGDDRGQNDT